MRSKCFNGYRSNVLSALWTYCSNRVFVKEAVDSMRNDIGKLAEIQNVAQKFFHVLIQLLSHKTSDIMLEKQHAKIKIYWNARFRDCPVKQVCDGDYTAHTAVLDNSSLKNLSTNIFHWQTEEYTKHKAHSTFLTEVLAKHFAQEIRVYKE